MITNNKNSPEARTPALAALDHLTVAALTLEAGVEHVRQRLGVVVPPGASIPLWEPTTA
jgi:hypothetical protein